MFNKTYYLSIVSIFVLLVFGFIAGHTSLMETASAADDKNAVTEKTGSLPNLSGQQAKDYLEKQGLYKSLNEAIAASRYSIYPTGNAPLPDLKEAFEANNPRQGFSTYFARDGVHLVSTVKSNEWRLHMNLKGLGYGDELTGVVETKTEVEKKKSRIEITKSASGSRDSGFRMVEWYENRKDGLEQGWTIDKKLTDSNEELKLVLELGGDLQARLASDSQAIDFVKNSRHVLRYDKLKSWDADGKELASRMELKGRDLSIAVDDKEAVYPITVDPFFVQTKKLTASDAALGDGFGWSVAISGDTAIVGAYANDDGGSDSGSAYIFERNQGGANNWSEVRKLTASDAAAGDQFGWSVAISGDTAIVGANFNNDAGTHSGSAYVFERNQGGANNWGEVRKLVASDAAAGDNFGYSVAISVDTVIVGAFGNDDGGIDSGSAYIFEQNQGGANNWGEVRKLTASDGAAFDRFGWSVGISGDTAIVGAYGNDDGGNDSGSAYIFERNQGGANNWGEVRKLTASDAAAGDQFGISVAISVDTAIVGAYLNDDAGSISGSAYIFERNQGGANNWGEVRKLTASDAAAGDRFGISVAISGDTAIVGAIFNGSLSGSAFIFERNQGGANNWGEVQKLVASDADASDQFGISVAISGDTAIVGAFGNDDAGSNSGSAYVITNQNNNWVETVAPLAGDGTAGDLFGWSVVISGDTAIVGAYGNDDGGSASGSAYIFERNQGGADTWGEVQKLVASDAAAGDRFGYSVAISGDTAIVGAYTNDDGGGASGSAYIFERNQGGANNWGEVRKLTASDAAAFDRFGWSVGISGDTAIVGAYTNDDGGSDNGSAYIFERNQGGANNWGEVRKLVASDAAAVDRFGVSVAISGDNAVVGAYFNDDGGSNSGSAYIFERNQGGANNWGEVRKLTASDAAADDTFGWSVGISGDTAIVGAFRNDDGGSDSGSAYIFERNQGGANNWGEVRKLTASDAAADDTFGYSVAISGGNAIVGAFGNDDGGSNGGSAYIFERNQGGANNWGEVQKLIASDAAAADEFGTSVAISGDTAIVGAGRNDIDAPLSGKKENKGKMKGSNLAGADQGRAYVFRAFASPTAAAANVSGRVTLSDGRALPRTVVHLTDQSGNVRTVRTNQFGFFRFENIEVGQTIILNAYHKQYQFGSRILNLDDSITDLILVAQ